MIEIQNLTKKIGENVILDNLSFSVRRGEILGFLGPNGAGKTTTMKIITSFWSPTSGTVMIDGLDSSTDSIKVRKKIGYLPETVPLYEDMKVGEYLRFVAEMRCVGKKNIKDRIAEVAESCGVSKVMDKTIDELSKGYRQRVGLAQAIMGNPDVLILDEPTTGLDPNQIAEIRELIKKIGSEKTVIFSTHILAEASAVCDRVIIINNGKIVGEGSPEELVKRAKSKELVHAKIKGPKDKVLAVAAKVSGVLRAVELKSEDEEGVLSYEFESVAGVDIRAGLTSALVNAGLEIFEIRKLQASLEDAFRELTK